MPREGLILDIYDDGSRALASSLGTNELPTKVASSELLEPEALAKLPDRLFALVGHTEDGASLRKYAMHDEGHLMTSIFYLLEVGQKTLTPEVCKVAAGNLVNACEWYEFDPPDALVKLAILGKAVSGAFGVADMAGRVSEAKTGVRNARSAFRQAQVTGQVPAKIAGSGHTVEVSQTEETAIGNGSDNKQRVSTGVKEQASRGRYWDELEENLAKAGKTASAQGLTEEQILSDPHFDPKGGYRNLQELQQKYQAYAAGDKQHWFAGSHGLHASLYGEKKADLNGTEMMPNGTTSKSIRTNTAKTPSKGASWEGAGLVSKVASAAPQTHTHFALPATQRYPIDTEAQVKRAAAYFTENLTEFPLLERRIYADAVWSRAQELGVKVAGDVLTYAGAGYGPHISEELSLRMFRFSGTGSEAGYEAALEKLASTPPGVMVDVLLELDRITGAEDAWGRTVVGYRDPYAAVYGSAKLADAAAEADSDELYTWVGDTDIVSGMDLKRYAELGAKHVADTFGDDVRISYIKDPIGIFKSLPEPQKVILSRLARSGTHG